MDDIKKVLEKKLTREVVKGGIFVISVVFFFTALTEIILGVTNLAMFFWIESLFNIFFFIMTFLTGYFGIKTARSKDIPEQDKKFSLLFSSFLFIVTFGCVVYIMVVLITGSLSAYFNSIYEVVPNFISGTISKSWFVAWGILSYICLYLSIIFFCIVCFGLSFLNIKHIQDDIDGGYDIIKTNDEDEEFGNGFEDDDVKEDNLKIMNEELNFIHDSTSEENEENEEKVEKEELKIRNENEEIKESKEEKKEEGKKEIEEIKEK